MSPATTRMLAVANGYDGDSCNLAECMEFMKAAYTRYLGAECFTEFF